MQTLRRRVTGVFAAIGVLYCTVTVTPVTRWWAQLLAGPWTDARGEVLIVLAAEEPNAGVIGLVTYWRCAYAVLVWREGGVQQIVVSGPAETARSMREFLQSQSVPGERILVENRSSSTRENAMFVRSMLEGVGGRKILLTSDMHAYRAVRTFAKAGLQVTPRPFPYALKRVNEWSSRWPVFLQLCVETVKIAGYRVRGWI